MTPAQTLAKCRQAGLSLRPHGDQLGVSPADKLTPELRQALRTHKAELLALLNSPPCPGWQAVPPDDLPLSAIEPRPTPFAREAFLEYVARQARSVQLTAWLERRRNAYFCGVGRKWDCAAHAFAASRDLACWQQSRNEAQTLDLLAGFDEVAATFKKPTL